MSKSHKIVGGSNFPNNVEQQEIQQVNMHLIAEDLASLDVRVQRLEKRLLRNHSSQLK